MSVYLRPRPTFGRGLFFGGREPRAGAGVCRARGKSIAAPFHVLTMERDCHEFNLTRGRAAVPGAELPQQAVDGRVDLHLQLFLALPRPDAAGTARVVS